MKQHSTDQQIVSLWHTLKTVRFATDKVLLSQTAQGARQDIGDLLIVAKISAHQHSKLYTLLHNAWILRRLELERQIS